MYYFPGTKYKKYDFLAIDIVNGCNLRCPFCINDWSRIGKNEPMDVQLFRKKIVPLFDLVKEGPHIYLSCLFEPTIHPHFWDFIEAVPQRHRKNIFFTTNLCGKLKPEFFKKLAASRIHHINISLDSLDPVLFERLRKGARHEVFMSNLKRLIAGFAQNEAAPKIYYETMLMNSNLYEIPKLVETLFKDYQAVFVEVRPLWQFPCNEHWLKKEYISEDDYQQLKSTLSACRHKIALATWLPNNLLMEKRNLIMELPLHAALRISSDGKVEFLEREVFVDLNDISNTKDFFADILDFVSLDYYRAKMIHDMPSPK